MTKIYVAAQSKTDVQKQHIEQVLNELLLNQTINSVEDIFIPAEYHLNIPMPELSQKDNGWIDDSNDIDPDSNNDVYDDDQYFKVGDDFIFETPSEYEWREFEQQQLIDENVKPGQKEYFLPLGKDGKVRKLIDDFSGADKPIVIALIDDDYRKQYDPAEESEDNFVLMMVGKALKNNCRLITVNYTDTDDLIFTTNFNGVSEIHLLRGYDFNLCNLRSYTNR